jgi:glycosyltransferase involved in cell wall biosynthesis
MGTSGPSRRSSPAVDDVRWFASNAYTALIVPELRSHGLVVATEGDRPARLALAMSGLGAEAAWRWSRARGARLLVYLWDLPPRGTARGRHDAVWWIGGRFLRLPRPWGGYGRRRGYYSRLRYIARRADAVWVPSAMSGQIVAERFGVQPERVPYCYDSSRFVAPSGRAAAPGAMPTLLTVSRLERHKNQALVLRAAAALDRPVQVRLIGRGPERAALESLASALGVSCRVETGADDATVTRAYREAAVALCPSRFEGFGVTPIEAVASGVPVVASDIPPHREFVGRAASLVPPDDPAVWAVAITAALDRPPADPALVSDLTIPAAAARFLAYLPAVLG